MALFENKSNKCCNDFVNNVSNCKSYIVPGGGKLKKKGNTIDESNDWPCNSNKENNFVVESTNSCVSISVTLFVIK